MNLEWNWTDLRFGIDNPCPIITKRLANYGNQEDIMK
jgi:hypothetical protein